jgi:hypothetical protein
LGGLRGAGSIRAGSASPSETSRRTARDSRSAVHGRSGEPTYALATLPHEFAGRIARGLRIAPELAVADGALGFWKALD